MSQVKNTDSVLGKREALRKAFLSIWNDENGQIDAFICPIAPHPVPPTDRYNGVSYTSSFVLLDYPAGVVPVRNFDKADMAGEMSDAKALGSWDKANRELCKYLRKLQAFISKALGVYAIDYCC
jgi:amidase